MAKSIGAPHRPVRRDRRTGTTTEPFVTDAFATIGANWTQTNSATFNDSGNSVARISGATGALRRSVADLRNGNRVRVRFRTSSTTSNAHLLLEVPGSGASYRRFEIYVLGGKVFGTFTADGTTYAPATEVLSSVAANTWYVVELAVDDVVGMGARISPEGNPAAGATYVAQLPPGLAWRFAATVQNTSVNADIDDYREIRGADMAYTYDTVVDSAVSTNPIGRLTRAVTSNGAIASVTQDFGYDLRGRQTAMRQIVGSVATLRLDQVHDTAADSLLRQ